MCGELLVAVMPHLGSQPVRRSSATSGLKSEVPIRTWSEWKGTAVGSLQADLVLHCGESTEGFCLTTLCAVDVATGWTELQPSGDWGNSAWAPQSTTSARDCPVRSANDVGFLASGQS